MSAKTGKSKASLVELSRLYALGLPVSKIALLTGYSRKTIYNMEQRIRDFISFNAEGALMLKSDKELYQNSSARFLGDLINLHLKKGLTASQLIATINTLGNLGIQQRKIAEKPQGDVNIQINFEGVRPNAESFSVSFAPQQISEEPNGDHPQ